MTVKDATVYLHFDDGMSTMTHVEGSVEAWVNTENGELSNRPISGREKFMKDAESKTFIELGCSCRRYKDLKEIDFMETEREVSDEEIKATRVCRS